MTDPALPRTGLAGEPCHVCGRSLAADQRYCLHCGARRGTGAAVDFASLLAAPIPPARAPAMALHRRPLRVPPPVTAAMALAMLLTGILIGSLDGARAQDSLTAAGGLTLRLPAAQPVAAVLPAPSLTAPPPPVVPPAIDDPPADVADTPVDDTPVEEADPADDTTQAGADATSSEPDLKPEETPTISGAGERTLPPIKHVFVIALADQGAGAFAAADAAPFLARTLVPDGTLLDHYHAVAHGSLPNGIALLSGQGPNHETQVDCPVFTDIAPGTISAEGQEEGEGCVYSVQTATLVNQMAQQDLKARAYVQDLTADPTAPACRRPATGAPDPWRDPRPGDAYATRRNPFVYFRAITDSPDCDQTVVDLSKLEEDLKGDADAVPAFSYVVPSLCDDGRAAPCAADALAGLPAADAWLKQWIPRIQASKAFDDGLIVITADQAPLDGPQADSRGCCGAPSPFPQLSDNGSLVAPGAGGGRVGALLLSPYVRKERVVTKPYNHFALLRTVEDLFGLDHLGYAAAEDLDAIGPGVLVTAQKP